MKLLVFTAAFYPEKDYEVVLARLEASCQKYGIDMLTYGKTEPFYFFESKIPKMGAFLDTQASEYTHCLYTDAADSFFLSGLDEVIEKYLKMDTPLVLSAEKACYPYGDFADRFAPSPTPYRYFNAGGFIGDINYVRDVLSKLKTYHWISNNDNAHWMQGYLQHRIDFSIDYHCEIFQTMSDSEFDKEFKIVNNRLENMVTHTTPSVVHFNGPIDPSTGNFALMEKIYHTLIK